MALSSSGPEWLIIALICFIIALGSIKKIELGFTLFIAALVAALVGGAGFRELWFIFIGALTSTVAVTLLLSVLLLGFLNSLLKETGLIEHFMSGLQVIISDQRVIASSLAALIGFLPILGGAIFSAPLVEEAVAGMHFDPGRKVAINVFYRHIIYLFYPLYPAMLITAEFTGLGLGRLILYNLPATIVALSLSFCIIFKGTGAFRPSLKVNSQALKKMLPVTLSLMTMILLAAWGNLCFPLAILAGLITAFISFLLSSGFKERYREKGFWRNMFYKGIQYKVLLAVVGILFLKDTLAAIKVLESLLQHLLGGGIPLYLLAILTPLLVSLLTGDNSSAMGILLPSFLALEGFQGPHLNNFIALMYISAFVGNVASPVHICLSLTKEYFQVGWGKVYRFLAPPLCGALLITMLLYIF